MLGLAAYAISELSLLGKCHLEYVDVNIYVYICVIYSVPQPSSAPLTDFRSVN